MRFVGSANWAATEGAGSLRTPAEPDRGGCTRVACLMRSHAREGNRVSGALHEGVTSGYPS